MRKERNSFLTSGDAGGVLGLSGRRVIQLADEGRLPVATRTEKGVRLFRRAVVEAFAAKRAGASRARRARRQAVRH